MGSEAITMINQPHTLHPGDLVQVTATVAIDPFTQPHMREAGDIGTVQSVERIPTRVGTTISVVFDTPNRGREFGNTELFFPEELDFIASVCDCCDTINAVMTHHSGEQDDRLQRHSDTR